MLLSNVLDIKREGVGIYIIFVRGGGALNQVWGALQNLN